jgi:DNA-binding GntR family transcriptional regulator
MMPDRPILNVKSLKEQVYDYLREQLRSGNILPGSAINLDETSRKLGVSRTPLRDALLQLESEGFVTIYPRRGVIVNTLSLQDIKNYYQIIGALESTAVLQAFEKIGEDAIRTMEGIIEGMRRAIESNDFDLYYEKNLALHDVYLASCGNENLVRIVITLKRRLYDFPRQRGFVKEWEMASIAEHMELLQLLKQRKAAEAAAYVRDVHWSYQVQEKYINQYYGRASSTLGTTEK